MSGPKVSFSTSEQVIPEHSRPLHINTHNDSVPESVSNSSSPHASSDLACCRVERDCIYMYMYIFIRWGCRSSLLGQWLWAMLQTTAALTAGRATHTAAIFHLEGSLELISNGTKGPITLPTGLKPNNDKKDPGIICIITSQLLSKVKLLMLRCPWSRVNTRLMLFFVLPKRSLKS